MRRAIVDSFVKLDPRADGAQPGDVHRRDRQRPHDDPVLPEAAVGERVRQRRSPGSSRVWLWFTVLFANFAEAVAEGRGKAQADTLRKTRVGDGRRAFASPTARSSRSRRATLAVGDECVVAAGELIPGDGEIIEGIASVDESAITGESAPVIRESGGDRSAVTGGTRVLSDQIVVRITSKPGETFLDRMIALVEGAVAAEDAERDRAQHPARGPDDHLPARRPSRCSRSRSTRWRRSRSPC